MRLARRFDWLPWNVLNRSLLRVDGGGGILLGLKLLCCFCGDITTFEVPGDVGLPVAVKLT